MSQTCQTRASGHVFLTSYRLALERLPQDRSVLDCELRIAGAGPYFPWRYLHYIHYASDVVLSVARTLQVIVQLRLQSVGHLVVQKRRVNADLALERPKEEHRCD